VGKCPAYIQKVAPEVAQIIKAYQAVEKLPGMTAHLFPEEFF